MSIKMQASDTVRGSNADCFVTIDKNRYNFMQMTEFESKYELNIADVAILGETSMGHKVTGAKGTWSGKAQYNQSIFRKMALEFKKTGNMPYFTIQVTNEDPASAAGKQTTILKGCLCDSFTLAKFQAGEDILDEDLSGTFEDWDMPDTFNLLPGMK